jgi:hypothetical protein
VKTKPVQLTLADLDEFKFLVFTQEQFKTGGMDLESTTIFARKGKDLMVVYNPGKDVKPSQVLFIQQGRTKEVSQKTQDQATRMIVERSHDLVIVATHPDAAKLHLLFEESNCDIPQKKLVEILEKHEHRNEPQPYDPFNL